jgi:hypothetical protein
VVQKVRGQNHMLQTRKASKHHGNVARKILKDWQFKLAYELFKDCEVIFVGDFGTRKSDSVQ